MNAHQRSDVRIVPVDSSLIDVLRLQTLVVLEVNHHHFEELLDFSPEAQHGLSLIYRDAFAVLDAIGWRADPTATAGTVDVPLTAGHIYQLHHRRHDLGATNLDRFDTRDTLSNPREIAAIDAQITATRLAAQALDQVFVAWGGPLDQ